MQVSSCGIRRCVRIDSLPAERAVILFEFPDAKKGMKYWWLVVQEGDVELCLEDPGHEVDLTIRTSLRAMTQIWMGDYSLSQARVKGLVNLIGTTRWVRCVANWLGPSPFAHVRPAATGATAGG